MPKRTAPIPEDAERGLNGIIIRAIVGVVVGYELEQVADPWRRRQFVREPLGLESAMESDGLAIGIRSYGICA